MDPIPQSHPLTSTPAAPPNAFRSVGATLAAIPSGFSTSEGQIVRAVLSFLGLGVVIFDALAGAHTIPVSPDIIAGVDAAAAAAGTYLAANYTSQRTALKAAALGAANGNSTP